MANYNYTSYQHFRALISNGSSADEQGATPSDLVSGLLELIKALQIFPTWITNYIFNIIYGFGIITNVILLMYLIYYKRYKAPVFCVILSLGIADLGACVGSLIFFSLLTPFVLGPLWICNLTIALIYLSFLSSTYHISMFAILRFVQLVYPLASRAKVTTRLLLKICLGIWITQFLQVCVSAFFYETVKVETIGARDSYVCLFTGHSIFFTWIIIVWIFVPFIAAAGFHVAKQVMIAVSRSATMTSQTDQVRNGRKHTDSHALAIVIVTYLVTMFPYIVQSIRVYMLDIVATAFDAYLTDVFSQICFSNSAINPWIYLLAAGSVRSDIRHMLMCKR